MVDIQNLLKLYKMGAVVGAVAGLAQLGIGLYQQHEAKVANEKAVALARQTPKQVNPFSSQQIPVEAYAAQEQANAQTEANLINAVSQQGAAASIGAVTAIQQQAENANAAIASQKAKDIQQIKNQEASAQLSIDEQYAAYQRMLDQMEIVGSGQAAAQGGAMAMAGLSGISSIAAVSADPNNPKPTKK